MDLKSTLRLLVLAAIWGFSFIFMRIVAPIMGPIFTANLRLLIAGAVLLIYFQCIKFHPQWRLHWKKYLIIGLLNCAIPFAFFCLAALNLPASYSAIFNSSSPLFAAVLSVF